MKMFTPVEAVNPMAMGQRVFRDAIKYLYANLLPKDCARQWRSDLRRQGDITEMLVPDGWFVRKQEVCAEHTFPVEFDEDPAVVATAIYDELDRRHDMSKVRGLCCVMEPVKVPDPQPSMYFTYGLITRQREAAQ